MQSTGYERLIGILILNSDVPKQSRDLDAGTITSLNVLKEAPKAYVSQNVAPKPNVTKSVAPKPYEPQLPHSIAAKPFVPPNTYMSQNTYVPQVTGSRDYMSQNQNVSPHQSVAPFNTHVPQVSFVSQNKIHVSQPLDYSRSMSPQMMYTAPNPAMTYAAPHMNPTIDAMYQQGGGWMGTAPSAVDARLPPSSGFNIMDPRNQRNVDPMHPERINQNTVAPMQGMHPERMLAIQAQTASKGPTGPPAPGPMAALDSNQIGQLLAQLLHNK